jgi:hypothetical protein
LVFNIASYTPAAGDAFTLFNMTGGALVVGDFSSVTTADGLVFSDSGGVWSATNSTNNVTYQLDTSTGQLAVGAVPEPSTYALLGLGAVLLLVVYRRRV